MKICLFCNSTFKSQYHSQRFCSETCANRFNLNGLKKVSLPIKSSELAEFVGVMLGDGNLGKYQTRVYLNTIADKEYIIFIKGLL